MEGRWKKHDTMVLVVGGDIRDLHIFLTSNRRDGDNEEAKTETLPQREDRSDAAARSEACTQPPMCNRERRPDGEHAWSSGQVGRRRGSFSSKGCKQHTVGSQTGSHPFCDKRPVL